MEKLKIHVSGIDKLSNEVTDVLKDVATIKYKSINSKDGLVQSLKNCDVFWFRLNHKLTYSVLKQAKCKYILCAVTGLDHIDEVACKEFGITIISLKGEVEFLKEVRATAEHTIGLLLALYRNLKEAVVHVEKGKWNRYLFEGRELYKKKIGILGLGRLGEIVADYSIALGMEVYYYDIENRTTTKSFKKCNSAQELCSIVDIISIHIPYNEMNHFMIDNDLIERMKQTTVIINTSRGGVVNEEDLLIALKNNIISGYATDVLYGEPTINKHPLKEFAVHNKNVIITPHIGGNTVESIEKTELFIANKLIKNL
ncbi:D-isomer specific 2-hydroxyacid dehydrogenase family protein [Lutibacter sp. TH_r2]|uniref:D-isomer specific 2-hydroxyacid dehydrogenase family protein n=1 Tax=Lutibacter sp. TH_r2 TaxID=3082083 RepID=UPI002954E3AE|nr:D-isomer specific 2-hydroxyacid dehydrogenase family protein [Lutibacter sp. TH_r2]MDV7187451.1 D-isomer specific 2-hydroxyacid dehydrogenase family protein [Lutibacter sp. TH_r2]